MRNRETTAGSSTDGNTEPTITDGTLLPTLDLNPSIPRLRNKEPFYAVFAFICTTPTLGLALREYNRGNYPLALVFTGVSAFIFYTIAHTWTDPSRRSEIYSNEHRKVERNKARIKIRIEEISKNNETINQFITTTGTTPNTPLPDSKGNLDAELAYFTNIKKQMTGSDGQITALTTIPNAKNSASGALIGGTLSVGASLPTLMFGQQTQEGRLASLTYTLLGAAICLSTNHAWSNQYRRSELLGNEREDVKASEQNILKLDRVIIEQREFPKTLRSSTAKKTSSTTEHSGSER